MLAIARAIMGSTRLLLMDEPSEGLAPIILGQIGKTVQELKKERITTLLAEQNLPFALQFGDYHYLIDNGANVFSGSRIELEGNRDVQARYLAVGLQGRVPTPSFSL